MIFVKGKLVVCYTVLFILPRDKWSFCFKHVFPILEFKNYGFEYIKNARIVSIVHTKKYIFNTIILLQKKKDIFSHSILSPKMSGRHFWAVWNCKWFGVFYFESLFWTVQLWTSTFEISSYHFWPSSFDFFILNIFVRFWPSNFGRSIWTVQFWFLKHHPSTHFEIFAAAILLLQHSGTNYSTCSRPFLWQKSIQIQLERFGTKLAIFQNAMSCRHFPQSDEFHFWTITHSFMSANDFGSQEK